MKKLKTFLFTLSVLMIAATVYKDTVMAAQVTRINTNRGLIVIDGTKDDGFVMGATVCFYSASGEELTCGSIQQTSESYATVKVNNREAKQIKFGMEAKIPAEPPEKEVKETENRCVDDSECGDDEVCIHGSCYKTK